jgi:hypothetical protein
MRRKLKFKEKERRMERKQAARVNRQDQDPL